MRFVKGDKIIVTRIKPKFVSEYTYTNDYPQIGWLGTIVKKSSYEEDEWIIKWDKKSHQGTGDFIREWMIEKYTSEWDNDTNT